jgi:DNA-binding HxlR family transcriptional regulator
MKSYGQFCPVAKAAQVFCERWTPLILRDLAAGATRFSELQRGVPLMSPTLLSRRLKQLEAEGIVERRRGGRGWTYHLTSSGQEFVPLVEALGIWGQRWSRRALAEDEVDLSLLIWSLERSVRGDAFGRPRTVVRIEFTDQTAEKRLWWFVHQDGATELCLHDPGHEVDLYLAVTLRDMIYIVRGDLPVAEALASGQLDAHGPTRLRRALAAWFNLSPLADVPSQRAAAAE